MPSLVKTAVTAGAVSLGILATLLYIDSGKERFVQHSEEHDNTAEDTHTRTPQNDEETLAEHIIFKLSGTSTLFLTVAMILANSIFALVFKALQTCCVGPIRPPEVKELMSATVTLISRKLIILLSDHLLSPPSHTHTHVHAYPPPLSLSLFLFLLWSSYYAWLSALAQFAATKLDMLMSSPSMVNMRHLRTALTLAVLAVANILSLTALLTHTQFTSRTPAIPTPSFPGLPSTLPSPPPPSLLSLPLHISLLCAFDALCVFISTAKALMLFALHLTHLHPTLSIINTITLAASAPATGTAAGTAGAVDASAPAEAAADASPASSSPGAYVSRVYYTKLIADSSLMIAFLAHYLHVIYHHGLSLTFIDMMIVYQIRIVVANLFRTYCIHREYLSVSHSLDNIPIATKEEIDSYDDYCAICREDLNEAVKLTCSHIFHKECLKGWTQQQATCPICRTPLPGCRPRAPPAPVAQQPGPVTDHVAGPAVAEAVIAQGNAPQQGAAPRVREWRFNAGGWLGVPHISFRYVNNNVNGVQPPANAEQSDQDIMARLPPHIRGRVLQVQEVLPHVPVAMILHTLMHTHSVEATIDRLLSMNLDVPAAGPAPEAEDAPAAPPASTARVDTVSSTASSLDNNTTAVSSEDTGSAAAAAAYPHSSSSAAASSSSSYDSPLSQTPSSTQDTYSSSVASSSSLSHSALRERARQAAERRRQREQEREAE